MESILNVEKQEEKKEKLWNLDFFLLFQGQLVSRLGDVIFEIALGFWVLAVTGSTALMGTLMAVTIVPRVLIAPFAGVIVDRRDRKCLIVIMDIIRGVVIIFIGIAAFNGFIKIWMLFVAQFIIGICDAFFHPAVSSAVPDIVPKSRLMNANSIFGIIQNGSMVIGSTIGGIVFQIFGAPLMFLFNGFSFLFSGILQFFMKIPKIVRSGEDKHFFKDMKEGYQFIWQFKGLRYLLLLLSLTSFIICIVMVLLIPLFHQMEILGPARYGVFMACLAGGFLSGMLVTSIFNIPPKKRMLLFMISVIISNLSFMRSTLAENFFVMLAFIFIGGVFTSIIPIMLFSTIQMIVPQDMRGKVFALIGMISESLMPLGMVLGGILAEFIPIRSILFYCFFIQLLVYIPFGFVTYFRKFVNFDPDKDVIENMTVNEQANHLV